MSDNILSQVDQLLNGGLSVIPARTADKKPGRDADEKQPGHLMQWKQYQAAPPTRADWGPWTGWKPRSYAIICGQVSGGLELLDFDDNTGADSPRSADEFYDPWWKQCGQLVDLYDLPVTRTGGNGYQVWYRCENIEGNRHLAWIPDANAKGKIKRSIAIETRGEGGFGIGPGSLHPDGGRYELIRGDLTDVPTIPAAVREVFFMAARALDEDPAKKAMPATPTVYTNGHVSAREFKPGESVKEAYNATVSVREVLEHNGYSQASPRRYSRPGKENSSGVDVNDEERMAFVYSSNDALFNPHRTGKGGATGYDAYGLFVELEHSGDAHAATKAAAKILGIEREEPNIDWSKMNGNGTGSTSSVDVDALIAELDSLGDAKTARRWAVEPARIRQAVAMSPADRLRFQVVLAGVAGSTFADRTWAKAVKDAVLDAGGDDEKEPKQADLLLLLASDSAEFFTGQDGEDYAIFQVDGHYECHPLRSKAFRSFLISLYYAEKRTIPGSQARQDAIDALEATASETREVFTRIGHHDGNTYLDLGNDDWQVVETNAKGWRVLNRSPIAFRRTKRLAPLPIPETGGDVTMLRKYLNTDDDHWCMVAAWTLSALYPHGPYSILLLTGEAGTAKTSTTRFLKAIIDPAAIDVGGSPQKIDDMMIDAGNSWVMAYDNLSNVKPEISDVLCRLATGGGYAKRQLHTDREEVLFTATRPVVMNGIASFANRGDLMSRAIVVELSPIPDEQRKGEREIWQAFDEDRPKILGAFLDALSFAIGNLPHTQLDRPPRMADFAKLAASAESILGMEPGQFMELYADNREAGTDSVLEASPIYEPLRQLVAINGSWEGTATQLLEQLKTVSNHGDKPPKGWPGSPRWLTTMIVEIAPAMRVAGVIDAQQDRQSRPRTWSIKRLNRGDAK